MTHLFDPSSVTRRSERSHFSSAGLGLAISRKLVDAMGSELRVESTAAERAALALRSSSREPVETGRRMGRRRSLGLVEFDPGVRTGTYRLSALRHPAIVSCRLPQHLAVTSLRGGPTAPWARANAHSTIASDLSGALVVLLARALPWSSSEEHGWGWRDQIGGVVQLRDHRGQHVAASLEPGIPSLRPASSRRDEPERAGVAVRSRRRPLMLVVATRIKLTSRGPVFVSVRIGIDRRSPVIGYDTRRHFDYGGTPFAIYKFRTMTLDTGVPQVWARPDDMRITPSGGGCGSSASMSCRSSSMCFGVT